MPDYRSKTPIAPLLIVFLVAVLSATVKAQSAPAGRSVTILSPQPSSAPRIGPDTSTSDKLKVTLPTSRRAEADRINPSTITVTAETVTLRKDDKITDLLEGSGISADVDALSLVYDLNPTLDDIRSLRPGTSIVLPRLDGDIYTQIAVGKGYRMDLARDLRALDLVNKNESALKKLSQIIVTIDESRFENPRDKAAIAKRLKDSWEALDVIGSNRFPVSRKVLHQSFVESDKLRMAIEAAVNSGQPVSGDLMVMIEVNSAALKARSDNLMAGGTAQVKVEVRTEKRSDGSPVPRLRVFYAPELDLESVAKYRDPSTPTVEALPIGGSFTFWAGEGDNSAHPLSDKVTITVRSNNNDPVKLQIPMRVKE